MRIAVRLRGLVSRPQADNRVLRLLEAAQRTVRPAPAEVTPVDASPEPPR
jgi:hypothetical protein